MAHAPHPRRASRRLPSPVCALALICAAVAVLAAHVNTAIADTGAPAVSVSANQLISGGEDVQLRGVATNAYSFCSGNAVYDATFAGAPYDDPDDDFADGPVNQWSIDVMKSWGINTVRLPVNESCWLGEPTQADAAAGQTPDSRCETYAPYACESTAEYRQNVEDYVHRLAANGLDVIIDLQFTAPPGYAADLTDHFPDAADAPTFWTEVAGTFAADPYVLFDLSGEIGASPYDGPCDDGAFSCYQNLSDNWTDSHIWNCWLNGCTNVPSLYADSNGSAVSYDSAGMQTLIDDVRATGASNPIIVASPDFALGYNEDDCSTPPSAAAGSQSCWSDYTPVDPAGQMIVDAHMYDFDFPADPGGAADSDDADEQQSLAYADEYINTTLVPLAQEYPVMLGEIGETDCENADAPFVNGLLAKLDSLQTSDDLTLSLIGWTWDADTDEGNPVQSGWRCPTTWSGQGGPEIISDDNGTPTPMGQALETWFQAKDPGHPAPPAAPSRETTTTPPAPTTTTAGTTTRPTSTSTGTSQQGSPPPTAKLAPHIAVNGASLICTGASFANTTGAHVSYSWIDAATAKRLAGPLASAKLAAAKVARRPVRCEETVTRAGMSVSASSRLLPVPGRVTRSGDAVKLAVICPAVGGHPCAISLALAGTSRHARSLGRARLTLRRGNSRAATVRLSAGGRRLLRAERTHTARLTVTETIAGFKQTIAVAGVAL